MLTGLRLDGKMIPRRVTRMFDERGEPRTPVAETARVEWRGTSRTVGLSNLSSSGAMLEFSEVPHIGEALTLQLADRAAVAAVVRWVRDGRIGIHFVAPLK